MVKLFAGIEQKQIEKTIKQVLEQGQIGLLDELVDARVEIWHAFGTSHSLEEHKQFIQELIGAFSDLTCEFDDFFIGKGKIAFRWTAKGKHTGQFRDYQPCQKQLTWHGVTIFHLEGKKAVKGWVYSDLPEVFAQNCE